MDWKWFLLSFNGRINRKPYWLFSITVGIAWLLLAFLTADKTENPMESTNDIVLLFDLIVLWPALAVQAKRWHDTNRSAWWLLINLVPIIGVLWALVMNGFIRGTKGDNRFGPDPLQTTPG